MEQEKQSVEEVKDNVDIEEEDDEQDEAPEPELMALAETTEEDTTSFFSPVVATEPEDIKPAVETDMSLPLSDEQFELKPDAYDIGRPKSPIPVDSHRLLEDDIKPKEAEIPQMADEESQSDTPEEVTVKPPPSDALQERASEFVQNVMQEAQATIREKPAALSDSDQSMPEDASDSDDDLYHGIPKERQVTTSSEEDLVDKMNQLEMDDIPRGIARTEPESQSSEEVTDMFVIEPQEQLPEPPVEHAQELEPVAQAEIPSFTQGQPMEATLAYTAEVEQYDKEQVTDVLEIHAAKEEIAEAEFQEPMSVPLEPVLTYHGEETDLTEAQDMSKFEVEKHQAHVDTLQSELAQAQDMDTESESEADERGPLLGKHASTQRMDISSESEDETLAVSEISIDSAVQAREAADLISPEDLGDSSSVDSFATVVAAHPDNEEGLPSDLETHEDRLAEIASMTSSFTSDLASSFHDDQLPGAAISIDVRDKEEHDDEYEDDEEDVSSASDKEVMHVVDPGEQIPVDELYDMRQRQLEEQKQQDLEMIVQRQPMELSVIHEESEDEKRKSTSSSEKLEVMTSDSSEKLASSPDVPPSPSVYTHGKFFNKSAERDDISVTSSLLEFEALESEMGEKAASTDSFPMVSDSPKPLYSKSGEKDDISISSSLAEFEQLEGELHTSDSMEKMTPESKGSLTSLNEFERLEQEMEVDRGSSDEDRLAGLEQGSLRSSSSSLAEFERLEQEASMDQELEAEAQKVVSMLESGAPIPSHSDSESNFRMSLSGEQLIEPSDMPRDTSSSSMDESPAQVVPQKRGRHGQRLFG